jgi:altronate dehydratase
MTNSGRYNMLAQEMDVNAGRYLDGTSMQTLSQETFELMVRIASGERSAGERVGFPQVQLWRDWPQTGPGQVEEILRRPKPNGKPLRLKQAKGPLSGLRIPTHDRERVGLIVPTSLCASQVAHGIAQQLNMSLKNGLTRVVALPHTEGCGASGGISEQLYMRTMAGYLAHPLVARALVLEHGCEKTHNDAMRDFIQECGLEPAEFGWASIQLDGGFEKVTAKVTNFFGETGVLKQDTRRLPALALTATDAVPGEIASGFATIAQAVVADGGSVVVPSNSPLLEAPEFTAILADSMHSTLSYGEALAQNGLHIMDTPTKHFVETLTGLGATGVDIAIAYVGGQIRQGHPLVPLIQVGSAPEVDVSTEADVVGALTSTIERIIDGEQTPRAMQLGNTDFQITRGLLGVSL